MTRRICFAVVFAALVFSASFFSTSFFGANECQAEPILFGPTPYLSAADSPFDLSGLGTTFFLEDFEDGLLNTPGVSQESVLPPGFTPPGNQTDSVDSDDGQIDGDGTVGLSLRPTQFLVVDGVDTSFTFFESRIRFEFDPIFGGGLPNAVGLVLTDSSPLADITLTAFDEQGEVIANITESGLDDGLHNGGTAEDRFFGITSTVGIAKVSIASRFATGTTSFQIDHLQYGVVVPEPSTILLMLLSALSLAVVFFIRRRD